ncbi:hypothetical protein [Parahaliea mediterranea]|uniref:hypothetical protein n=1 Tax=Parahaliea mediterranea TaxID=651086 RepID=UPI0013005ACD|nr:hypothetical protein [Parahaliea mediterranea]
MLRELAAVILILIAAYSNAAFSTSIARCVKEIPLTENETLELERLIAVYIGESHSQNERKIISSIYHEERSVVFHYSPHDRKAIQSKYGSALVSSYTVRCSKIDSGQPWECQPPNIRRKLETDNGFIEINSDNLSFKELDNILDFVKSVTIRDIEKAFKSQGLRTPKINDKNLKDYKSVTFIGKSEQDDREYFFSSGKEEGYLFFLKKRRSLFPLRKYKIFGVAVAAP